MHDGRLSVRPPSEEACWHYCVAFTLFLITRECVQVALCTCPDMHELGCDRGIQQSRIAVSLVGYDES
eukprot:5386278-Lingulodinium_polyedra.AAC.1